MSYQVYASSTDSTVPVTAANLFGQTPVPGFTTFGAGTAMVLPRQSCGDERSGGTDFGRGAGSHRERTEDDQGPRLRHRVAGS